MRKDRETFIRNIRKGDEVFWTDPGDGCSSGVYVMTDVNTVDGEPRDEDTVVWLRNDVGSEAEVFMRELS